MTTPSRGSKIDDICYKWSLNGGYGFQVGQTNRLICVENWSDNRDLISDMTTCYGYYYCPSQTAVGTWNRCPNDQHFDALSGKCVSPESYPCVYNRCNNVGTRNMAFVNTGCRIYQVCSTGAILQCPTAKPYFDEVTQSCEPTKPAYNICL